MKSEYLDCYLRVSTQAQIDDGSSLSNQEATAEKVAKSLGLKCRIHNEGAKSSTRQFRSVLDAIERRIKEGEIKNIWVIERERLFRDNLDSLMFRRDYLEKYKVNLFVGEHGAKINFDSTEDKLTYDLFSRLIQYENEKRLSRSQSGKRYLLDKVSKHKAVYLGGTATFGYSNINKEWVVNKAEAKWVKWIFKAILEGKSVKDIKLHLDRNGVKPRRTKSGLWNLGTIQKMLANESYTGVKRWFDKELQKETVYEIGQIISHSLFSRVRKEMEKRQKHKDNNKKHFTILDGLLYCECGLRMGSIVKTGTSSKGYAINTRQFYCVSRERKWKGATDVTCTNHRSVHIDKTSDAVTELVKDIVSNSNRMKSQFKEDILSQKFEENKDIALQKKKLEVSCRTIVSQIEDTIENLSLVHFDELQSKMDEKVAKRLKNRFEEELIRKEKQLDEQKQKIDDLDSQKDWLDWVAKFGDDIETKISTDASKQEYLNGLLGKIVVHSVSGKDRDGETKQIGHKLELQFKIAIVDDKFEWTDKTASRWESKVSGGKKKFTSNSLELENKRGNFSKDAQKKMNSDIHGSKTLSDRRIVWYGVRFTLFPETRFHFLPKEC